ncbi:hypothetical protein AB1Y20_008856 [Prymnesium parvum]|uniref:Putative hydroxypyruvate isomerase n=1 Tax=Prymnesium parvum TaxID=97485 RepID=A0AB34IUM7_PRYPA
MRLAANLSFLFTDAPLLRRFSLAARCGFRAVEMLFPYDHPAPVLAAQLHAHRLTQALFNAPPGDWAAGERGLAGVPGRRDECLAGVRCALEYARALECPSVHVMAGTRAQGAEEALFVGRMREAAELAREAGVRLCVEPLNRRDMPGYLIPDTASALRVLDAIGCENVGLQLDLYHLQARPARRPPPLVSRPHESSSPQIANPPGRHEPGEGEVHFDPLFSLLDKLDYQGFVGCEYKPSQGDTHKSLGWAKRFGIHVPSDEVAS